VPKQTFQQVNAQTPALSAEPEPLFRDISPEKPYPVDALGPVGAPMATKLHAVLQAPLALVGQSVLSAMGQAAQGHADVLLDGRTYPLSLNAITIALSGERKTATDGYATRPQHEKQAALNVDRERQMVPYTNAADAFRKSREEALKKKTHQERLDALAALGQPPEPPLDPVLLVSEPTYEALVKLLATGQPSVGLFSNEGGRFVGGYAMSPEQRVKTLAGLNELWDGSCVTRSRAGDGTTLLYGRRLSLHLMLQPRIAQRLLSDPDAHDIGFLARCLLCWPTSTIGQRDYQEVDISQDPHILAYNEAVTQLLDMPLPLRTGTRNELNPRTLPLIPLAKRAWIKFHDEVEKRLGDGQMYAPVRAFGSKAAEHALRIAGVLTIVEKAVAVHIDLNAMRRGIVLAKYYLDEWLRLVDAGSVTGDLADAHKLLTWAQQFPKIYTKKIYQFGPYGIRDKTTALKLIGILEDHGWFRKIPGGATIDGAHRLDAWEVKK
jgi:hypothetical protein